MINDIGLGRIAFSLNASQHATNKTHNAAFDAYGSAPANLDSRALVSSAMRVPGGGMMSASVFKAESFSANNPVMLVRDTDSDGRAFEAEVNINNVNPNNASFIEMFALDGYFVSNGQPAGLTRAATAAMAVENATGKNNAFSQFNFLLPLKKHLETQLFHKNWDGFMQLKTIIDNLSEHIEKRV